MLYQRIERNKIRYNIKNIVEKIKYGK